jgi:dTMP kinase
MTDVGDGRGVPGSRARRENALVTLFRIPIFRRMWASISFSSLGDWLGLLANTALAQQLVRSQSVATQGVAISGVILVRLAPDLLFGPFAAAIADKLDRRKTVVVGETVAAVLYLSIAFSYELVWLYIAQFVIEAVGLFTSPAKQVIWVNIVPKKLLATANQISLFSVYGTVPIAAALFALLSTLNRFIGKPSQQVAPGHINIAIFTALVIDAITFLVSASTVWLSRRMIPAFTGERQRETGVFTLLSEGVAFVRGHVLIRALYVGVVGAFAAGGLTVGVAQLYVATLSAGTAGYSIVFGSVFTGLAIGMIIGPRVLPTFPRSRVFGLAIGSSGVALIVMSLLRNFILATGFAALVGLFAGMAWIIGYTLIGQEVEDRLRGRTFAFVLSSVRIMLLLTIAVGPLLAGWFGSHSIRVGSNYLRFSGPGLTLLLGGVLALFVSLYAASRSVQTSTRLRDLLRRRLVSTGIDSRRGTELSGLFLVVDGAHSRATRAYAALLAEFVSNGNYRFVVTSEPTDTPTGRRVRELLRTTSERAESVEPETAALLSAADRAEHVAAVIRPALQRGEVVVCERYMLTSLALHGAGRGADIERIRGVNLWGSSGLQPDLALVVDAAAEDDGEFAGGYGDVDGEAVRELLVEEAAANPDRYLLCPVDVPPELPVEVRNRLVRLMSARVTVAVPDRLPG